MRVLFDQNISHRVVDRIKQWMPQAKHIKEMALQGASDRQIWNFAKTQEYHIITFDADFYDMVTLYGHPPKVIWLRLGNTSTQNLIECLLKNRETIQQFLIDETQKDLSCLEITG